MSITIWEDSSHHVPRNKGQHEYDVVHMEGTVRERLVLVLGAALVAAILAMLGACIGVASASAPQTDCSGLQAALDTAGSGATVVLDGMCTGSYTLPADAAFTLEGAPGTTSGFDGDGASAVNPLLATIGSEEAGAVTISHLTFQHADLTDASALSIRASRVTLSDDSFLDNEGHGKEAHAAFVRIGPSGCPSATDPAAITLTDSTFSGNRLVLGSNVGGGAGAWLEDACEHSRNVLEGNTFEDNTLEAEGTAAEANVTGGGLQFMGGKTQPASVGQSGNVFDSNRIVAAAPAEGNYGGGGEWLEHATLSSIGDRFSRNTIAGTTSTAFGWSWGAGVGIRVPTPECTKTALPESTLEDATVVGNAIGPGKEIDLGGGGVFVGCSHLRVLDSTITLNTAPYGAGIEGEYFDQLELANSIVAEDSPGNEIAGFYEPEGGSLTATFSDVCTTAGSSDPLSGAGNICTNPLLADNGEPVSFDVHETASSPTIDAGSNALVPSGLTTDAFGTPRILAGHTGCTGSFPAVVDIGASELSPSAPSCPAPVQERSLAPGPAAAQKQAPAPGLTHFVSLELSSTGMALRLSCSSADGQRCSGRIYITTNEILQGKKIVAVSASKRTKTPVRIGQAAFSLGAGSTATIHVKLNSIGLKLLHRFHAFSAWILANGAMPNDSQAIFFLHEARFSEPKQKQHKKSKVSVQVTADPA